MLVRHHIGQSNFMLASKGSQDAELVRTTSIILVLFRLAFIPSAWHGKGTSTLGLSLLEL